mmetsp:Transcript_62482/g.185858  ORF Transcript_62482/g.185858 Transcript_62482/m.185858 type:complete len:125 (-) Transcript_62482:346-720(-)
MGFAGVRWLPTETAPRPVAGSEGPRPVAEVLGLTASGLPILSEIEPEMEQQYARAVAGVKSRRAVVRGFGRAAAGASAVFLSGWVPNVQLAFAEEPPVPEAGFDLPMLVAQMLVQIADTFHLVV